MCFGMQETGKKETATTFQTNPFVAKSAVGNMDFATQLRDTGFKAYGGEQVAPFSTQQQNSFGMADAVAGNGTAPRADAMISGYAGAPAASVSADTISSRMSPYMNQYVMQALAPTMHQMDLNDAAQRNNMNAVATSSGAFGDARAGVESANLAFGQGVNRAGVIGNAYDRAFNTAIGAGAQDVSNNLSAQNANASYYEQALARALGGSTALQNLQNQQMGVAKSVNEFGQQQTAQDQARLNAQYQQWAMAQQYPFQTADLVNRTTSVGAQAFPANKNEVATESKPDNSGWALGGALLSAFI